MVSEANEDFGPVESPSDRIRHGATILCYLFSVAEAPLPSRGSRLATPLDGTEHSAAAASVGEPSRFASGLYWSVNPALIEKNIPCQRDNGISPHYVMPQRFRVTDERSSNCGRKGMLDSLAKDNLLKVLERVAPELHS
jgi:hypothetical protein